MTATKDNAYIGRSPFDQRWSNMHSHRAESFSRQGKKFANRHSPETAVSEFIPRGFSTGIARGSTGECTYSSVTNIMQGVAHQYDIINLENPKSLQ